MMAEETRQNPTAFRIKAKHKKFADLLVNSELSMDEIAAQLHRCRDTLYVWLKTPEVQALVKEKSDENVNRARRIYSRFLPHAAQCVVLLLDTMEAQDPNNAEATKTELVHSGETVLKAVRYMSEVCDLIEKDKKQEEGNTNGNGTKHPLTGLFETIGELDTKNLLCLMGDLQKRVQSKDTPAPPSRQ